MIAWTWYIGLRTSWRSDLVMSTKRNLRLRREGEVMISPRVKHFLQSLKSPKAESGINTSTEASCCPWTRQRIMSSSPSCRSRESTVKALPGPSVISSDSSLEQRVKVKGRLDSRSTGLRLTISSAVPYDMSSATTLNKPEKQQVLGVSKKKPRICCSHENLV